jgi:hypothetical protein
VTPNKIYDAGDIHFLGLIKIAIRVEIIVLDLVDLNKGPPYE